MYNIPATPTVVEFSEVSFGLAASLTIAGVLLITVITRAMNRRREARGHAAAPW